jgi:hypothetical protein
MEKQITQHSEELSQLNQHYSETEKNLTEDQEYQRLKKLIQKETYRPDYLKNFIDQVLASWMQEGSETNSFPTHSTEQILVALGIMSSSDHGREEFLDLYRKNPHALMFNKVLQTDSHYHPFSRNDFMKLKDEFNSYRDKEKLAEHLLQNSEDLALLVYGRSFYDPNYFPEIGFRDVTYPHPKKGLVKFADCMESSILNFLAMVLKDLNDNKHNPEVIRQSLRENHFHLNPAFENFLSHHSDISIRTSLTILKNWIAFANSCLGRT